MNIVYTINGEGMGHAIRSSVVIDYLLSRGHEVTIFSAGVKPLKFLRDKYKSVAAVSGMHMVYEDNKLRRVQTALRVLRDATGLRKDLALIRRTLRDFRPHAVITDFDYRGPLIASLYRVPLISVDNVQVAAYARLEVASSDRVDYVLNAAIARMMVPRADHYVIASFFNPELKKKTNGSTVHFVPPLLRSAVISAQPTPGDHIIVYQTSDSHLRMWPILSQCVARFVVYGVQVPAPSENMTIRPFSEQGLIQDLASCKGVITNGGFNVITESLFLKKPVLSIPIKNHFEQRLNGLYVQKLGFGLTADRLTPPLLQEFIDRLPDYRKNLSRADYDPRQGLEMIETLLLDAVRAAP